MKPFSIGINYWPVREAMHMWRDFDPGEIAEDFARLADIGLSPVRIFLLWEDFQPDPLRVNLKTLDRLAETARLASDCGIQLWATLFTGHMSGANWFPEWMVEPAESGPDRFPIVTGSASHSRKPKNPYEDAAVRMAQKHLIREAASVLRGHPALWGWDLGNEPSNCYQPGNREQGRIWLREMVAEIRKIDNRPVTLGSHQEDLEQDRCMGPEEIAEFCDCITMHAYPAYSAWARNKTDPVFPLFLTELTRRLSGGRDVWMSEFGISTGTDPSSVDEESAARYAAEALELLRKAGVPGALWWCFGDYAPGLWTETPFREKIHERSFGIFRDDLTPKPIVAVLKNADRTAAEAKPSLDWFDPDPVEYWENPAEHIERLYRKFIALR